MFYKTEVRIFVIEIVCHLCSSLGQSKVSSETTLSEASVEEYKKGTSFPESTTVKRVSP